MKFRRIPQEIEAFQMTRAARHDNSNWPAWLGEAWQKEHGEVGALWPGNWSHSDGTDELLLQVGPSTTVVAFGNWILNIDGELSVMHNRVFVRLYEHIMPADEEDEADVQTEAEMRAWAHAIAILCNDVSPNADKWARFFDPERLHADGFTPDNAELERLLRHTPQIAGHVLQCVGHERFGDAWVDFWCAMDAELMIAAEVRERGDAEARRRAQRLDRERRVQRFCEFFCGTCVW